MTWSSRTRVARPVPLSPVALSAVAAKEGFSRFGPPRDGFRRFRRLFDGPQQRPGERFEGQSIGAGREHEFAQLGFLPVFQRFGSVL